MLTSNPVKVRISTVKRKPVRVDKMSGLAKRWTTVASIDLLSRIAEPSLNAIVCRRSLSPDIARFAEAWMSLKAGSTKVTVDTLGRVALPIELQGHNGAAEFRLDVRRLVNAFRSATGAQHVTASLEVVTSDRCKKFHVDYKGIRLVCSYAGPGTEWVDDHAVRREHLCKDDTCFDSANARIVPRASSIQRALAGDVVLLKGEGFPGNTGRGVVHRSPSVEKLSLRRLVLTLDEG